MSIRAISITLTLLLLFQPVYALPSITPAQSSIRILGPDGDPNPVVNENSQITLVATDQAGRPLADATFESGSPEIATVDPKSGQVRGIRQGYATITARTATGTSSIFVTVTRLSSSRGKNVPGDTKSDISGAIYLSDPVNNVIFKRARPTSPATLFAGRTGERGLQNGPRLNAAFAGPVGVAVDNRPQGGIYIADALNHSIRKVGFNDEVSTVLGNGQAGVMTADTTAFEAARFNAPQGVAVDVGGNLYVADTDNHAIYIVDFDRREVRLLAGQPGRSGKLDGKGRSALFSNPRALAISQLSRTFGSNAEDGIFVADSGNNRIRFITRDGRVSTLGRIPSGLVNRQQQADDEFVFDQPRSISTDSIGNVYVVDATGARVITQSNGVRQLVLLAQKGSFGRAESLTVRGNETFVLDSQGTDDEDAVKTVTIGAPEIASTTPDSSPLSGDIRVTVTGRNFAPDTLVTIGDSPAADITVESATRLSFTVPVQIAPGVRTLSIQTRGGIAQRPFQITPPTLNSLASGQITTYAGGIPFVGDGGLATTAALDLIRSEGVGAGNIVLDGAGNLYIADTHNHRIRRVDAQTRIITTIAGTGRAGFSGDLGLAINATLDTPRGIAIDDDGNIYIADTNNFRVRRIEAATGIITTVAGNGLQGLTADGLPALETSFFIPIDLDFDLSGNLLIADGGNNRVYRLDQRTNLINTLAGSGEAFEPGSFSGDGGPATNAKFNFLTAIAVDRTGNIYIADTSNHRIRRVDNSGIVNTIAGDGFVGEFGSGRFRGDGGSALDASFNFPIGLALDSDGNLYVGDSQNYRIRRIDLAGTINTIAGSGSFGFSGDGGSALAADMIIPNFVQIDGSGSIYIVDSGNLRVRKVDSDGTITTYAGRGNFRFGGDGEPAISASFNTPREIALDQSGNLFIADQLNSRARRIDAATQIIATVAGNGTFCCNSNDGGSALEESFANIIGVAVTRAGDSFYVAARDSDLVYKITNGIITRFAGGGSPQNGNGDGGQAREASLNSPRSVAVDRTGNLFIAEGNSHRIRRVDAQTGIITTVAGNGQRGFSGDGSLATNARLAQPTAIAVDAAGNLYIADSDNFCVRRVSTTGIITTVAGRGDMTEEGSPANLFRLGYPQGVAVDSASNLFIAVDENIVYRVDSKAGTISRVAGTMLAGYSGDGSTATEAYLADPMGLAVDTKGNLFISDSGNNSIRVVKTVGTAQAVVTLTSVQYQKPNLTITGTGFGATGAVVQVNGTDITSKKTAQSDTSITLKGNKKKLALKKGANQVIVTVNGIPSNTFIFNF